MALSGEWLGFSPGFRGHVLDLPVRERGQAGEHVAQVGLWVDATAATGFDDREQDGAALACLSLADEQPVLLADRRWPDGVLDGVVVDLDATVFEIHGEHGPHGQRVVDRSAHGTAWQNVAVEFEAGDGFVDAPGDHAALAGAHGLSLAWACLGFAQLFFDAVEVLDL